MAMQKRIKDGEEFPACPFLEGPARMRGISRSTAYRCVASGDLPIRHLGGRAHVVTSQLRELLESA